MTSSRRLGACAGVLIAAGAAALAQTPVAADAAERANAAAAASAKQAVEEKRIALEKRAAAERFVHDRAELVASPVFQAAKQWTPAVADDAAARLARVAELCPECRLIRPAEAVPLGALGAGAAPVSAGGENPILWLAEDATADLREKLRIQCPECVQIDQPVMILPPAPSGGTVVFQTIDPGVWSPDDAGDPCGVPAIVKLSAGALDAQIRAALARGDANVSVSDYEAATPRGCERHVLLYQLSVASQLLGGGVP
jgi:hypothetical protein